MNVRKTNKRKAISPVLATVILIAITLVAGVAIAGFAFGLFGSLSATANVQITAESCNPGTTIAAAYCNLTASNTGSAPATATGCSLYGATGTLASTTIPAGASGVPLTCTAGGAVDTAGVTLFNAGTSLTGQVSLSNGATLTFSNTWT